MNPESHLLRRYVEDRSEAAFTELVQQHVNLVYFAALRRTAGNTDRAEEIAQQVFISLARKAAALTSHGSITGWLYTATQFAAHELHRTELRRRRHEQKAHAMNEDLSPSPRDADWDQVRPVIDDALSELPAGDRDAVLLRFFENRAYADVGAALQLSENAARMRVDRALGKLRDALAKRGVTSTTAALTTALAVPAASAAPAGLGQQFSAAALAGIAASGTGASLSVIISTMISTKLAVISVSAVAVIAIGVAVRQQTQLHAARSEAAALNARQTKLQSLVDHLEWRLAAAHERAGNLPDGGNQAARDASAGATGADLTAAPTHPITRDMVEARLQSARSRAQQGDYAAALRDYLWCYDTGMRQVDGYFLIRYSSLLNDIATLGKQYPAALEALKQRRDAAKVRLLASGSDLEAGKDFGQINRVLGEDDATTALFDSLSEDDPRRGYLIEANIGRLIAAQRYRELAKAMPYAGLGQAWEQMTQVARSPGQSEAARTAMEANIINFAASQIEVRAGAGDLVDASDLIERLLIFNNSPETVAAIKQHLQRAGHPELVTLP